MERDSDSAGVNATQKIDQKLVRICTTKDSHSSFSHPAFSEFASPLPTGIVKLSISQLLSLSAPLIQKHKRQPVRSLPSMMLQDIDESTTVAQLSSFRSDGD